MRGSKSVVLALAVLAACDRGAPARQGITVQEARASAAGTPVTVEGIVSVPSGVIDAGFAITDGEAGIHVAADSTKRFAAGDRVRVSGKRDEVHQLYFRIWDQVARTGANPLIRAGPSTSPVPLSA